MEDHFWEERGLSYRTNNIQPERTTLVFIHGLGSSSSVWAAYEVSFEQDYNVISVDLRGHGKSLKPSRYKDYEFALMASDILGLLDHLNVKRYVPITHSLGVVIAILLMLRRSGAVAAIFINPVFEMPKTFLVRSTRWIVAVASTVASLFSYSHAARERVNYAKIDNVHELNIPRIFLEMYNTSLHVYVYCLAHLYLSDLHTVWDKIRTPILVIHGKRDGLAPLSQGVELARRVAHGTLVEIPAGNHVMLLPLAKAPEIEEIIKGYVRGLAAPHSVE